jgi:F-type H+-transporting ATPase subunit b
MSQPQARLVSNPDNSKKASPDSTVEDDPDATFLKAPAVRAIGRFLHISPEASSRLFIFLNFAILAGTILYFGFSRMPKYLRERRDGIQREIVEAKSAADQARERLQGVEQRFARLDDEIAQIRESAERESQAEESRIRALIEAERTRIVTSAEQEIAAASAAARRNLKRLAGDLAVDRATQMISLTEDGDRTLVRQFSDELEQRPGNGGRN